MPNPRLATTASILALCASSWALVCGDCDGDDRLTIVDALTMAQIAGGALVPSPRQRVVCDASGDGIVTVLDALQTAQKSAGLAILLACRGTWHQLLPRQCPEHVRQAACAYDRDRGVTVFFGGVARGGPGAADAHTDETWEWDGTRWQQCFPPVAPAPRRAHAMAYDAARRVTVLFGGIATSTDVADTWEWDGMTWTERLPPLSPPPRGGIGMAYDELRSRVVVYTRWGTPPDGTWEWDGSTWSRVATPTTPFMGWGLSMAYDSNRGVVVMDHRAVAAPDGVWEYDGADWVLRMAATSAPPRDEAGIVFDAARDRLLTYGGLTTTTGSITGSTWVWDRAGWAEVVGQDPVRTAAYCMAYDEAVQESLVISGRGMRVHPLVWNGAAWRLPDIAPPAGSLAYDAARHQVVSYNSTHGLDGDRTWVWGLGGWTALHTGTEPPPRRGPVLAYDAARQEVVLVGGFGAGGVLLEETWLWNGSTWRQAPGVSPPGRLAGTLAHDVARARTVLHGGLGRRDTWEWDGSAWTQASPATVPPDYIAARLVYDRALQRVLLLGASLIAAPGIDVWAWDGADWQQVSGAPGGPDTQEFDAVFEVAAGTCLVYARDVAETWRWDGAAWVELAPLASPPARTTCRLVHDPDRGITLLRGGPTDLWCFR